MYESIIMLRQVNLQNSILFILVELINQIILRATKLWTSLWYFPTIPVASAILTPIRGYSSDYTATLAKSTGASFAEINTVLLLLSYRLVVLISLSSSPTSIHFPPSNFPLFSSFRDSELRRHRRKYFIFTTGKLDKSDMLSTMHEE